MDKRQGYLGKLFPLKTQSERMLHQRNWMSGLLLAHHLMETVSTMVVGNDVPLVKDKILLYSVHALGGPKEDSWGRWRATLMETYS